MKKKKKGGKGKRKGSKFERQLCWALSRFVDPDGTDTIFWRSAMSGGRATVQQHKGIKNVNQAGDITCIDEKGAWLTGMFCIESKFYKDLDIDSGLLSGMGLLAKFWKKHCKVSKKNDRHPLLIAKQNRTQTLALFDGRGHHAFQAMGHETNPVMISYKLKPNAIICLFDKVFKPKVTREDR